jgi:hypothetical protein
MHPDLYRSRVVPKAIKVDLPDGVPGEGWNRLEENCMGEFGWKEVLKQFLDEERASKLAFEWNGDDYATYEQKDTKKVMLFTRTRFNTPEAANNFFQAYSEVFKKKYPDRTPTLSGQEDLEFDTPDAGGVFLQCIGKECVTLEGGDAKLFSEWTKTLGWPVPLPTPHTPAKTVGTVQTRRSDMTVALAAD